MSSPLPSRVDGPANSWVGALALALLAFVAFAGSLGNGFALDD
jgi:hypothetical protein